MGRHIKYIFAMQVGRPRTSIHRGLCPASACYPSSVFIAMGQIRAMQPLGFKEMVKMKVLCKEQCAVQMWPCWQWLCLWFPLGIWSGRRQWATVVKSMASDQADLCDLGAVKPPLQASVLSSVKWVHYPHRVCLTRMSVSVRIAINTASVTVAISVWLSRIKFVVTTGLSSSTLPQGHTASRGCAYLGAHCCK